VINDNGIDIHPEAWKGSVPSNMEDCITKTIQMRRMFRGSVDDFFDHVDIIVHHGVLSFYANKSVDRQLCEVI
jgi:hypothetical protein